MKLQVYAIDLLFIQFNFKYNFMEWVNNFFSSLIITTEKPFFTLSLFFLGGLLSSLFPCYYPLIPITVGFLQKRKAKYFWIHPLLYWMGTLFTYMFLGIFASLGGVLLTKILQNGWAVLGLGLIYLYLGFAVLDFVSLEPRFFRTLEGKAKSKDSFIFTFLMGILSGLAASACVSPALVSVLLFVVQATSYSDLGISNLIFGIALTISYGAGLGVPFFISGIIGGKLPKSGMWMDWIKKGFFVIILIVAYYQIQKGLNVLKIEESVSTIIFILITFVSILSYFVFKNFIKDIIYFRKYYTYFTIAISFVLLFFSIQIFKDKNTYTTNEKEIFAYHYGSYEYKKNLKIYRSFKEAVEEANKQKKPIFIDFYADWCTNCVEFSKLIEHDNDLNQLLTKTIFLKILDTDPIFDFLANEKGFEELQIGLPFFVIMSPNQQILYKSVNYRDKENFRKVIEAYLNQN